LEEQLDRLDVNFQAKRLARVDDLIEFYSKYTRNGRIAKVIVEESLRLDISINLAFALAWKESGFNPRAVSPPNRYGTRDWGLFQLNDGYRKDWKKSDFFDINKNTQTALSYLRICTQHMGSTRLGLAAYNAGMHRVQTRGIPPSTRKYIATILSYEKRLELDFALYFMKHRRPSPLS
jgi:soluble lytic murein transglycosylase-like protein